MAKECIIFLAALAVDGCDQSPAQQQPTAAQTINEAESFGQRRATGALDSNCGHSGKNPDGSYEFMVMCPASFASPDGRWKIVMGVENGEAGAPVTLQRGDGSEFAALEDLSDGNAVYCILVA